MFGHTVYDDSIALRLSAQRALWGHVPACLRSASIQKDGNSILWRCVFDAGATEDDLVLARVAGTEILADFSSPADIGEEIVIIPFPEEPTHLEHLVYLRHEHNDDRAEAEPRTASDDDSGRGCSK